MMGYVLGSLPFSVWTGLLFFGKDVRRYGSGNAGATNTFRVLGRKAGTAVLILDTLKGYWAASLPQMWFADGDAETENNLMLAGGLAAVVGHVYSIFLRFKGGKGVATSLGVMLALAPWAILGATAVFLAAWLLTSYISLGSLLAAAMFPLFHYFWYRHASLYQWLVVIALSGLIFYTHRSNIQRLLQGKENRMPLFRNKTPNKF
jgi:glycerol-3-phosphate acyltransferase PlsY